MSWFQNNHEADHCDPFGPFVRDCPSCAFRGGDSSAAQQDSARPQMRGTVSAAWDNRAEHGAAPERCVNTAEGLTPTRLPTRPGGFSG
jgi:hypothetical protein